MTIRPRSIAETGCLALALLALAPLSLSAAETPACSDCHPQQADRFSRSAMAAAATTRAFLDEQSSAARPQRCLLCHSPGGGSGVACTDCHDTGSHPYPRLDQVMVCGRCHDGPGENTVRSFLHSPAAASGRQCTDCHAVEAGRFSHDFRGPTRSGFLQGVASLRAFLRFGAGGAVVLVRIRHRAGHALPGGTTGRAVWLRIQGMDGEGTTRLERQWRFGRERQEDGRWLDHTLPPGAPVVVELPLEPVSGLRRLHLELIYRFRPGPLDADDPAAVILDHMEIELPR